MISRPDRVAFAALAASSLALVTLVFGAAPSGLTGLESAFRNPPADARIMMRWWWFGAAVDKAELGREIQTMKDGGIGGFEIQPVYPLTLDDPARGIRNLPYLSSDFLSALRFAADRGRQLGLRVDLTLCSGWPYGGPQIPVTQASGMLRVDRVPVPANAHSVPLPNLENGETLLAAFLARGDREQFAEDGLRELTDLQGSAHLTGELPSPAVVLFFIASRTGMLVKRPAVGADGFVLDHYDPGALANHLQFTGDRLLQAFGPHPPYAVFSDSLEVYNANWTGNLLEEFRRRRGYDLKPLLPALIGERRTTRRTAASTPSPVSPKSAAIRGDWGRTLTELANEHYLAPLREWARRHGTRFRSQTYGSPPVTLSSNALVDLPEGEGFQWRRFSTTRWASSASHLYGRPVTSSETWTWLHSPAFRATPLDMKAEADLHFLEGINQLIGHGWPYSPPSAGKPGWRFYAAAVFNDHNPWWLVFPDIARYLQRISFLLRQGKPANDVALYLPTSDAWSRFTAPGSPTVSGDMESLLGPAVIPAILDAGYNFDFIDDEAIQKIGIPYRAVILPGVERIPLAAYQKLQAFAKGGGALLATRRPPSLAPGLLEGERDTAQVQAISQSLFKSGNNFFADETNLGDALHKALLSDLATSPRTPEIGFVHRKLDDAEIYFLANTSNQRVTTEATFRVKDLQPEIWDAFNGTVSAAAWESGTKGVTVALQLEPYESTVLVFSKRNTPSKSAAGLENPPAPLDISRGWSVRFEDPALSMNMPALHSWTEDERTRFYSGQAVYEKTATIPEALLRGPGDVLLSFGAGTPIAPSAANKPGMRALLESPVREAAVVYINENRAGTVWRPPYKLSVKALLHVGENRLRVVAGNLAINALAGQALPDYRLLNSRYGVRFTAQDMENLEPLPSGLLGPIKLVPQQRGR